MKIAIATDAWTPQINGVVTTLRNTAERLSSRGIEVLMLTHEGSRTYACPGYPEIRLALMPYRQIAARLHEAQPDAVHIATEGPIGMATRRFCLRHGWPFATSLHTRFPEYLRMRAPLPLALSYAWLRHYHAPAHLTLVRSETQRRELSRRGFKNLQVWPGAVDTTLFRPRGKAGLDFPRPISMYMGRVSVEKGLEDFLSLDLPGTKVVVGGGPSLEALRQRYPTARFLGPLSGESLAHTLSAADVMVFPSRTDTFGLVILEAMACGVPVAAFPVPGPADLVREGSTGALDQDLAAAVFRALRLDGDACVAFAKDFGWDQSTDRFLGFQAPRLGAPTGQAPGSCPPLCQPETEHL